MKLIGGGNPSSFHVSRSIWAETVLTAQSSQKRAFKKNKKSPYEIPYENPAIRHGNRAGSTVFELIVNF